MPNMFKGLGGNMKGLDMNAIMKQMSNMGMGGGGGGMPDMNKMMEMMQGGGGMKVKKKYK